MYSVVGDRMNYQISYDCRGRSKQVKMKGKLLKYTLFLTASFAIILLLGLSIGVDLKNLLQSAETMAKQLQQGSAVQDVFAGFCLDILQGSTG